MNPARCPACGTLALSLTGQLEQLDSYYLEPGGPPSATAGYWHTKCLLESNVGGAWATARLRNFVDARGYVIVAHAGPWTVLSDPRDGARLAISEAGPLLVLPSAQRLMRIGAGVGYREHKREYNLHLPDAELIEAMQRVLVRDGACPLSVVVDALRLAPHLDHPEVLADARFLDDAELREEWTPTSICAPIEYNVHVPPELVPCCI